MTNPVYITTKQLAEMLNMSPRTLEVHRIHGGGIPYLKFGGAVRYDMEDVKKYLEECKRNSTSE